MTTLLSQDNPSGCPFNVQVANQKASARLALGTIAADIAARLDIASPRWLMPSHAIAVRDHERAVSWTQNKCLKGITDWDRLHGASWSDEQGEKSKKIIWVKHACRAGISDIADMEAAWNAQQD